MVKNLHISLFCLFSFTAFAQSTILTGQLTSKRNSSNAIFLYKGMTISEDGISYLSRPCEFQDTTYYWHFKEHNSLEIEIVIRSCSFNRKDKIDYDSVKTDKSVFTKYEAISISAKEIRLSLWDKEEGEWALNNNVVDITGTKTFDGTYNLRVRQGDKFELTRRRANR